MLISFQKILFITVTQTIFDVLHFWKSYHCKVEKKIMKTAHRVEVFMFFV